MTVGELKQALEQFDDSEIVVAGIPWWECNLTADISVERYERGNWDNWHWGRIDDLPDNAESVVLVDARGRSSLE